MTICFQIFWNYPYALKSPQWYGNENINILTAFILHKSYYLILIENIKYHLVTLIEKLHYSLSN